MNSVLCLATQITARPSGLLFSGESKLIGATAHQDAIGRVLRIGLKHDLGLQVPQRYSVTEEGSVQILVIRQGCLKTDAQKTR